MADNDILVTTRYTTEGYDKALSKADRVGSTMLKLSRDIGGIGRTFNNEFLMGVSNALGGIEDMIGAVSELGKSIKAVPALGGLLAGAGGAFIGSKIYDATIGMQQGTSTQKILDQLGQLIAAGFDTNKITQELRVQAQNAQIDASNAVFNFKQGLAKNDPAANAVIAQILGGFSGFLGNKNIGPRAQAAQDVAQQQRDQQILGEFYGNINTKIKAATTYQDKLAQASKTYNAAEFDRKMQLSQLEADITQKRIAAAQSLTSDLSKMDSQYYANRLAAAESFGLETARAEEDHQRQMRQLQMSHDKRMSKLADSRDALGLEDEIDAFESERSQAEDEYSVMQSRRNQDYANQMRDMERAFQTQRQERINAYNQQLIDIAAYNKAQRDLIAQQMQAIAKAVMDAFTQAAKDYTAAQNTLNNTSNTANVTQNINGQSMSPEQYKAMTYAAIQDVFGAAR
ncbi:MAG: hypothetical protein IPO08_20425 [Xanthomonadales bacterium]|nr:hypothetical protein [Xanthomonadales bacterium]